VALLLNKKAIAADILFVILTYAKRNRTSAKDIGYALYLYFLGLSYRNTSKALSRFIRRSHVSVWKWVQHYKPERISFKRGKISKFIIDETQIKVGQDYFWIWVAIEPIDKVILGTHISLEMNMLIAEEFLYSMINKYGNIQSQLTVVCGILKPADS
jgi:putative transposase